MLQLRISSTQALNTLSVSGSMSGHPAVCITTPAPSPPETHAGTGNVPYTAMNLSWFEFLSCFSTDASLIFFFGNPINLFAKETAKVFLKCFLLNFHQNI